MVVIVVVMVVVVVVVFYTALKRIHKKSEKDNKHVKMKIIQPLECQGQIKLFYIGMY